MSFVYKRVTIPLDCLKSLWTLSLSKNEWGGRFKVREDMYLDCNLDLIKGTTKQEEVGENSHLYLGEEAYDENRRLKPVKMASLSFSYEDYTGTSPQKINVIFHTHPLLLVRDDDTHIARIALPSLGDLFAHCVYSNLENHQVNGHLNGYIVVAFEGAYVYNIMPHKFAQLRETYDRLLKQHTQDDAIDILKKQVFDALRPINKRFFSDMKAMCDARPDLFGTEGAPDIQDSMWTCKGCEPHELDFPFAEGIHTPLVRTYARNNPFTRGIALHGFQCEFFPAPFTSDLSFIVPTTC